MHMSSEMSPSSPYPPRKRRARATLSCSECRQKKLKCDRQLPCLQCKRSRREASCSFSNPPARNLETRERNVNQENGDWRFRPRPNEPKRDEVVIRERSTRTSDGDLEGSAPRIVLPLHGQHGILHPSSEGRNASQHFLGRVLVKGPATRYQGPGDKMEILHAFEDAKDFILNSPKNVETKDILNELSLFRDAFSPKSVSSSFDQTSTLDILPGRSTCDALISNYFDNWGSLLRILHVPTFLKEVDQFWESTIPNGPPAPDHILPQLLATITIGASLRDASCQGLGNCIADASFDRIQKWLDNLPLKYSISLPAIRTRTLLLVARQTRRTSCYGGLWTESGFLLRSAMLMGLHRTPQPSEKDDDDLHTFSTSEKEQRLQLWFAIVELNLEISLACGMPSGISSNDFASFDPRNLHELNSSGHLQTDLFPWTVLVSSVPARLDAANFASSIDIYRQYPEALRRAKEVERLQTEGTNFTSFDSVSSDKQSHGGPGRVFTRVMMDVYLRRPSLYLVRPYALVADDHFIEARRMAIKSSVDMLSHLDTLDPAVADLNVINSKSHLHIFHILCKTDIIQAALVLCFEIKLLSLSSTPHTGGSPSVQHILEQWTKPSLTRIVEITINSLLARIGEFGSDLKDILSLSIVLQSVRSNGTSEEKQELMKRAAERVLKACREVSSTIKESELQNRDKTIGNSTLCPLLDANGHQQTHLTPTPSAPGVWRNQDSDLRAHQEQNGSAMPLDDLNMMPATGFDIQDFGLLFDDWDMGMSWL